MATVAPTHEPSEMSVGRVLQRAFSAITFNPAVILGLSLVVGALPTVIMTYVFYQIGVGAPQPMQPGGASFNSALGAIALSTVLTLVISALVQGALTRAAVSANEGVRASFGESLATGIRVILPLIGLSLLYAFAVGIGFLLLLIPGIILILMWAVAVPALVVERGGILESLSRSAELTKGSRWKILGLFCVLGVSYWLLSFVIGLVGLGVYGSAGPAGQLTITSLIGSAIVGMIFNALWGTIQPSLYVELRRAKEGDSVDNLEQIFA